jgi:hypothetical protein
MPVLKVSAKNGSGMGDLLDLLKDRHSGLKAAAAGARPGTNLARQP